jgi:hypothetical protein
MAMSTRHGHTPRDLSAALARAERAKVGGSMMRFSEPPPEVQCEMAAAARASIDLAAQGRELRFDTGPDGRVSIELTDSRSGRALERIGPAGLFALLNLAT